MAERQEPKGPAEAANETSALLTARLQNRRIEVLDQRSETSTVWAHPDGLLTWEESAGPVRVRQGDDWADVDLTLRKRPDGTIAPVAHPRGLALAGGGIGAAAEPTRLAELKQAGGSVDLLWPGRLPEPEIDGTRATYRAVRPGVDLVVEATRTGFEDFLIARDRRAAEALDEVELTVQADGLTVAEQADGSHLLTGEKQRPLGVVAAPRGWDAELHPKSGEATDIAGLEVRSSVNDEGDVSDGHLPAGRCLCGGCGHKVPGDHRPGDQSATVLGHVCGAGLCLGSVRCAGVEARQQRLPAGRPFFPGLPHQATARQAHR